MSCIPKKGRRPSHEFLSEFSISQKLRLTYEKQHLKLRLDKLDVQRKRSLDVIENERRQICASILQQNQNDRRRQQNRRMSSASDDFDQNAETQQEGHLRTPRELEESTSGGRSVSVDLGKQERRLSVPALSERIPRSAGTLRRPSLDVRELNRTRSNMTPERVLSLSQRRHSDTSTVTPVNFCTRPNGRRFSFSQNPESEKQRPRTPNITNTSTPARRMSVPVLFPSLNTGGKPNLQVSKSLDSPRETPRNLERRHSLNTGQCRLPRQYSTKKMMDTTVAKMAGMHGVMQRTSIFQIQENEAVEEV